MKLLKHFFCFVLLVTIQSADAQYDVIFNVLPETAIGATDGQITLSFSNNWAPYQFIWTGPSITSNTAGNQNQYNLESGEYCVTVSNIEGCIGEGCVDVFNCGSSIIGGELVLLADVPCETGLIDLNVSGGIFPYSYHWEYLIVDGTGISMGTSNSEDLFVLSPGSPCVTVTDACGTSSSTCYPTSNRIGINLIASNSICQNDGVGSIDISVSKAVGSVQYLWNTGASTEDLTNLSEPGTYCLTVTDSRGCSIAECFVLEKSFSIDITVGNTCSGDATGFIEVVPPLGGNFSYEWDFPSGLPVNPQQNSTTAGIILYQVSPGIYGLTVTDDFGCTAEELIEVSIDNETSIIDNFIVKNICGTDGTDGSIEVFLNGNPASFSFAWSNGQNTRNINNLTAGNYCLTITNVSTECFDTKCFDIVATPDLLIEAIQEKSCPDQNTGSVTLAVTGGTPPYEYNWNNGNHGPVIANVGAGFYSVTITDANSCNKTEYFNLPNYTRMSLNPVVSNVCFTQDGSVDLTVSGGSPPYDYQWNNGGTSPDLTGLPEGEYCVVVTDINGCRKHDCITIEKDITASVVINPACEGEGIDTQGGRGQVYVNGNNPPFTASWSDGSSGLIVTELPIGAVSVTVTDHNGCSTVLNDVVENEYSVEMHYGLTSTCTAKYYCGEEKVGSQTRFYDKEWAWLIDNGSLTQWNYDNPCAKYRICPIDGGGDNSDLNKDSEWNRKVKINGVCFGIVQCLNSNPLNPFIPIMVETDCDCDCSISSGGIPDEVTIFKDSTGNSEYFVMAHNLIQDTTYVWRFDEEREILGEVRYAGAHQLSLNQTKDKEVIFSGSFTSQLSSLGKIFEDNKGGKDIFIAKYNNLEEEKNYLNFGSSGDEAINDLVTDDAGNIYATGFMEGLILFEEEAINPAGRDAFVMKSDPIGNIIWIKQIGGDSNETGLAIDVSLNGTVYLAGTYDGDLTFDNSIISPNSSYSTNDGFLIAINSEGGLLWNTKFTSTSEITGVKLKADDVNNVTLLANYESDVQLLNNPGHSSNGNNEFFICKYDNIGNLIWINYEGGGGDTYANGLALGQYGDIYVIGDFSAPVLFSNDTTLTPNGESDIFINKYTIAGNLEKISQYGGLGPDYGSDITAREGEVAFVGYFYGDELSIENRTFIGQGVSFPQDYLFVFTEEVSDKAIPKMIDNNHSDYPTLKIEAFPNPFNDQINLIISSPQTQQFLVKIMNIYGQVLNTEDFLLTKGKNNILLEVQNISEKGTYFIQFTDGQGNSYVQKFVKI